MGHTYYVYEEHNYHMLLWHCFFFSKTGCGVKTLDVTETKKITLHMLNNHSLLCNAILHHCTYCTRCQEGWVCWFFFLYQTIISTYIDCNACSGAVTFSHATLQHLLHNLCCDWQASINLARLCSIIISPAIQLDSSQQASWHCEASQRKFPVSRQDGWLLLQWIFYGGTCQYNAEYFVTDKHMLPPIWHCVKRMLI